MKRHPDALRAPHHARVSAPSARPRKTAMRRRPHDLQGFTLVELMVTIAIAALLGLMVVPNLISMVDSGKTSVLVNKFPQDVAWARNQAVTTQNAVEIDLTGITGNACTWTTKVAGQTVNEHSLLSAQFAAQYPGVTCSIQQAPVTGKLVFDSQGFISDGNGNAAAPTITVTAKQGQTWTMQMLTSGSVILSSNTAS